MSPNRATERARLSSKVGRVLYDQTAALLAESDHLVSDRVLPVSRFELDPYDPVRVSWRLRSWPNTDRLDVAFRLALDTSACEALLLDGPVDPERLDRDELREALRASLVKLARPIDVLLREPAA